MVAWTRVAGLIVRFWIIFKAQQTGWVGQLPKSIFLVDHSPKGWSDGVKPLHLKGFAELQLYHAPN